MRWILLAALIATPAIAADQFDLVCTAKKAVSRYRVDLIRGEYCADDCQATRKIDAVTDGMLIFQKEDLGSTVRIADQFNRATGEWYRSVSFPRMKRGPTIKDGICRPAPFTGLPAAKP